MEPRRLTQEEKGLLTFLIGKAGLSHPGDNWMHDIRAVSMDDGGMGSLKLVAQNATNSPKKEKPASDVQFSDEDGVDVLASLYVDNSELPIEIDIWKTDFSPLVRIPVFFGS